MSALVRLDMTAAFDTVNHSTQLQQLQSTFGICDTAHRWFPSYLSGHKQHVRRGSARSSTIYLVCGMPQGSVLGLILFVLYTVDLIQLDKMHGLSPHLYADDVEVYGSCSPAAVNALSAKISDCTGDTADWAMSNRLKVNPDTIWCTTIRHQHQLQTAAIPIIGAPITPALSVRDHGIYTDADLSMQAHVKRTVTQCFAALRQLRQICRAVPTATFQMLVVALVHSRLDYGNA